MGVSRRVEARDRPLLSGLHRSSLAALVMSVEAELVDLDVLHDEARLVELVGTQ
jgi:hypothetical protein